MDHYKTVVMDYLQADRALFVNNTFCIQIDKPDKPEKTGQPFSCDAVAIDLRHGAVYLCQAAFEHKLQFLMKKLCAWSTNWESIKAALQRDSRVPAKWRIHVWLFIPKDTIEMLDGELERLRTTIGSRFKVKITALEDVQPWRATSWERCEAAWETKGQRVLI